MNKDIIKNLDSDLLLKLREELSSTLKYQRKYWIKNDFERTSHLNKLIKETREELEFIIDIIKIRGLKYAN